MRNHIQPGNSIDLIAPSGGVVSGVALLVGIMLVVPATSAAEGAAYAADVVGVFELPKATGQTWTPGAKLYWDNTNKVLTTTASGNTACAIAWRDQASGDTAGWARLTPST